MWEGYGNLSERQEEERKDKSEVEGTIRWSV